ncbi:hypothetical protein OHC33_002279 [Knufia fluminis]|uniref:alpha-galactosidase n=1 Tax=Knufia fluminis TaxID=191047 RepID=A0AAN8EYU3_9EURO|nr:hypothetical protein OHC33_002279 [Knufia fluminis]
MTSQTLPTKTLLAGVALACTTIALPTLPRQSPIWQPPQGLTWDYHLLNPASATTPTARVMAIDLFDNTPSTITALHSANTKVICYFSAGSYENWRPDWTDPIPSDVGNDLDGWEGEKWAGIRSQTVRAVMAARIALAQEKGCDAVDPDNIDGYNNENGLGLTSGDSEDFMRFLATEAHGRGLAIGLKNSLEIVDSLTGDVDFAVNEQCHEFSECDVYGDFVETGKAVFHVEYPKGEDVDDEMPTDPDVKGDICGDAASRTFSTIMKNMDLDQWIEFCDA